MFTSLHNHTEYSNVRFLDCINKPKDLIMKAINLGFKGIAITDHECLSSAVTLLTIRDAIATEHPDFKIIFGNEIYLVDQSQVHTAEKYYHFILLAKDITGWNQLKQLSSRAWERGKMVRGSMRVPTTYQDIEEIVGSNPGHVIGASACLGGELDIHFLNKEVSAANNFVKWAIQVFGQKDFYLEIQVSDSEEQKYCNNLICKFADFYKLKYIITTDSHYLEKEDAPIHAAFLNSKLEKERETEKFYKYTYPMSEDEMCRILRSAGLSQDQIDSGFAATMDIYNAIDDFELRKSTIVPNSRIPDFTLLKSLYGYCVNGKYPAIKLFYETTDQQDAYLMFLIEQGLADKGIEVDDTKLQRLNDELSVVNKVSIGLNQKVSSYFLLMKEIMDIAWNYSFIGVSRGSSAGFYINYLLGLVQIDPLQYNLPYWRFINDVRFELPDIDTDLNPAQKANIMQALKDYYGNDNVLNCITFKTETLKAAILTAMKGNGYNNDDAQALSSCVPVDRGYVYSLQDCEQGNSDLNLEPAPDVVNRMKVYPNVYETVKKIEGLKLNSSIHASAVYIFNNGYLENSSLMRAPNGTRITAFDMGDTNAMSGLKTDLLYTDAQSKMMKCFDLLLKNNQIEWQGSLRSTYNKYIHPDVLDYTTTSMWEEASNGQITDLFQWITAVGAVAIKKAQPRSVAEMATINSAIRVQSEGSVQPIDRYIRYHNDIALWYLEMAEEGLNSQEIKIMERHLLPSFGCSFQQEDFMQLVMDPEIAGFSLKESNKLRKVIAHKVLNEIAAQKKLFHESAVRQGTSKALANYVWDFCIEPLAKYSFSVIHATGYSVVAVQEMNLATRWNPLYWQCACLCVNAGNADVGIVGDTPDDEGLEDGEDDREDGDNSDVTAKIQRGAPNYGKIAKAIADMQRAGVTVGLPDINLAQADFVPDIHKNRILFSLNTVSDVNNDLLQRIIAARPFTSLDDFISRITPTTGQVVSLIKAGAFEQIEPMGRKPLLLRYLNQLAEDKYPVPAKMGATQVKKALELSMDFATYGREVRIFKYKRYIDAHQLNNDTKRYELTVEECIKFFHQYIEQQVSASDYGTLPGGGVYVKVTAFKKAYDVLVEPLMNYLNTQAGREAYAEALRNVYRKELQDKYAQGSCSHWEMETMCFYYSGHELAHLNKTGYAIQNFESLPEKPVEGAPLSLIAGTVIDTNNTRHTVTLLTEYGVVDVKFYGPSYIKFNQKISVINKATGKKNVIEDSWFKRGNLLMVYGIRKENMFHARTDRSQGWGRTVGLIEQVLNYPQVKYSRKKAD